MREFEETLDWAKKGWSDCRITLDTTRRQLELTQKEAQRWQAHSVLVEDQRDAARKERDAWLAALKREQAKHLETLNSAIAEQDFLREQLNDLQAGMRQWEDDHASAVVRVIAERDALRKQLDDLKHDYTDKSYWGNT